MKDTVDKAFCLTREHFNVENDEKIFGETSVICYLDGYKQEIEYVTGSVGMTLAAKRLFKEDSNKSMLLLKDFFAEKNIEVVVVGKIGDQFASITWAAIKIKNFKVDLEKKVLEFNLGDLLSNIIKVFTYKGIVQRNGKELLVDLKTLFPRLEEILAVSGTFNRLLREWKPREEKEEKKKE